MIKYVDLELDLLLDRGRVDKYLVATDLRTDPAAEQPCELVGTTHKPVVGAPGHLLVNLRSLIKAELGQPLVEYPTMPEETVEKIPRFGLPGHVAHLGHHPVLGEAEDLVPGDVAVQQVEGPLQHGRGGTNPMMPVNLAEHHVARKNHHLGSRLALLRDG